jgi:hypothetical protein
MSTYVVRFASVEPSSFRGRVQHVRTGESAAFASPEELLAFFARMNAVARRMPEVATTEPEPTNDPNR